MSAVRKAVSPTGTATADAGMPAGDRSGANEIDLGGTFFRALWATLRQFLSKLFGRSGSR